MDKVTLKSNFLKHKNFLRRIYERATVSHSLNAATTEELKILLLILHNVAIGEIPIAKTGMHIIEKAHRLKKLQNMASRQVLLQLQKSERIVQIKFLRQFLKLFPILLNDLFHKR